MITALGAVFLPLCLWFWRTPARLLELVFIGSVFAAAAVMVFGGYGVTPALIPAVLFIGFFLLKLVLGGHYPGEKIALGVMAPFLFVVLGAVISSFLMPRLFEGEIFVWPQKLAGFFILTPLAPNSGNYTQDMYLLINAALAITASIYLTRGGFDLHRLLNAYFVSGLLAVVISLWQFAGDIGHVWFPTDFFLSNPGWALLSDQSIGTILRITGPFSEPAALAGYLCGSVSAAAWVILNGGKGVLPRLLCVSGLAVILLCTSTTGYVTLALLGTFLAVYTIVTGSAALRKRVIIGLAGAAAIVAVCIVTIPVVAPGVAQNAAIIVNATLTKQDSSSYNDRTSADRDSVQEMVESDGLGVGWGSNRSSSLGPGLCASVGIWGIFGLLWFAAGVVLHVRAAHRAATSQAQRMIMHACSASIFGTLTAAFISGPSISSPDFYVLLALLVATAARVRVEAASAATLQAASYSRQTARRPSRLLKG
jgi:hypothetical protein